MGGRGVEYPQGHLQEGKQRPRASPSLVLTEVGTLLPPSAINLTAESRKHQNVGPRWVLVSTTSART